MNQSMLSGIAATKAAAVVLSVLGCGLTQAHADELCEPAWDVAIGQPGMNNEVQAFAMFDDGTGPALYAGGKFTLAGEESAPRLAKWDGQNWSALPDAPSFGEVWSFGGL